MLKFRLRRVLAACAVIIFFGTLLGTFHEGTAVIPRWTSGKFQSVYDPPRLHPIEIISSRQRNEFEKFTKSQSRTFKEAVNKYRVKYKRNPPPGFLQWYRYTKSLHATIIDDFDQIYNGLEPFWGIEPEVLRGRINGLFKLDSVEKISIRNGTLVECTGDWRLLLEGHELLQDLPDMDIAANGLDEPRIIASWDKRKEALDIAAHHNTSQVQKTEWSRINFDIPAEEIELSEYKQRTPHDLFADACPPDSGLRVDDHVLTDDIEFVEGTQAFDLCNLPSFDHLHGFGFAPASFIVSTTLAPIFSQAKLSFVSDILFPSPMFVTHADDDSSLFLEKRDQMVWRGSTTGTSNDANWRQSHRARLMSMVYSHTSLAPLLVNDTETRLPTPSLKEVLCDVGFTGMIQCETSTCDEMKEEFGTVSRLTYEEIVRFKYLLDIDGNSFSQRSIDLYRSHALPIRAATFIDWQTERMFPWVHFVPLSVSFKELWSILLYYRGGEGIMDGAPRHNEQAELIAEGGREWACQDLAHEDMQIYMARVLLEYARVIRDDRDELGYDGDGSEASLEPNYPPVLKSDQ